MTILKMTLVATALLALAGCVVEPIGRGGYYGGGGGVYYGGGDRDGGHGDDHGGGYHR